MSFALLSLICLVALLGPALALPRWLRMPVIIGELVVGIVLGATGFNVLDSKDATFSFLAQVGFALVMFVAGSHVPLRSPALRSGLGTGALRAGIVAVAAIGAALGLESIFHTGHWPLIAVLLASSSAAVVLPALSGAPLGHAPLAELIPQIALADAACVVLLPLVIEPAKTGSAALGALVLIAAGLAVFIVYRAFERSGWRKRIHEVSEDRGLAIELRFLLAALFGIAALAVALGVSTMLAGFALGLAVAAVGEPKRVAKQVFALEEGLFAPIFYVWLGASLDLRALGAHPEIIGFGVALGIVALLVHSVPKIVGQPLPVAALTAAQLGVPIGAATLGTQLGILGPGEPAALLLGALITVITAGLLAPRVSKLAAAQPEPAIAP